MSFSRRNYSFRVYPTPEQCVALESQGHAARALWNLIHDAWEANGFRVGLDWYIQQIKAIRQDEEYQWFADLPGQAAQAVWKSYFQAWKNCWSTELASKAPTYKKRHARMGIDIPQARDLKPTPVNKKFITVNVPLAGKVKVRLHRQIDFSNVTGARLIRDGLGWHIIFRTKVDAIIKPTTLREPSVGVDRGVKIAIALSDENNFAHGDFITDAEKKLLLALERRCARQETHRRKHNARTSNRQRKTRADISAIKHRQARRRKDFLDKASRTIAKNYSHVVLEELDIKSMTKRSKPKPDPEAPGQFLPNKAAAKSGLNKAILNESWGNFHHMVAYKTQEYGGTVSTVNPHYTSQTCAKCHVRGNRDSQAIFLCTNTCCHMFDLPVNADTNAAQEILYRGTELASSGRDAAAAKAKAPRLNPSSRVQGQEAHTFRCG